MTTVADNLTDAGVVEFASVDTLRKRLTEMFKKPQTFENGDTLRCETGRVKGKPGRSAQLILEIAEHEL